MRADRPNGFTSPALRHDDEDDDDDRSSRASSSDWTPQPQIGSYRFIQQHIMRGTDPRAILKDLLPETVLPADLDDMTLWQIIINISEPPKRKKRKDVNTLEDVVRLLKERRKILVLTGAGVSVSCGIPDFRSRDGIYARLAVDFPDLPDPQAMFDIDYFRRDPRPFFKFAKVVPHCPRCPADVPYAIMKPDIVFFGENLPEFFHRAMKQDKDEVDLLIVIGSSLKVRPVALIPSAYDASASQYLFQAPNRYIFHGAEVYSSSEDESSSSCDSDSDGSPCSADAVEHEDSDGEEDKDTDGLAETVQDHDHKRLQTDCTAETEPPSTQ
ncbi:hypothetical protein cypCar_00038928 [Cyprinus carpio]|nr:hypothetical protein cypCar_00038928 [Cyprinus carpio]